MFFVSFEFVFFVSLFLFSPFSGVFVRVFVFSVMACSSQLSALSAEDFGRIVCRRASNRDGSGDSVDVSRPLSDEEVAFLEVLHSQAASNPSLSEDVPSGSSSQQFPFPSFSMESSAPIVNSDSGCSSPSSSDPISQHYLSRLEERLMEYFDSCFQGGDGSDSNVPDPEVSGEGVRFDHPRSAAAVQRDLFLKEMRL